MSRIAAGMNYHPDLPRSGLVPLGRPTFSRAVPFPQGAGSGSEPGRHQIPVSYRYLRLSAAGSASVDVDVPPDQVVQVSYQAPKSVLVAFLPGKLTIKAAGQS